jgi:hypothetical protein
LYLLCLVDSRHFSSIQNPLRRFAFRIFAFLSPYRRLKATISYRDVFHRSKDQPFKTFHVFFIPFFICLILYLFTFYHLALTSAAFRSKDKYRPVF